MNKERGWIQEKARLVSMKLHRVKKVIIKSPTKNINEKNQLTAMLKPFETSIQQLVHLSESLAEQEMEEEQ